MESLRWILLAAGIIFVLVIYFLGRNRRRRNDSLNVELEEDLPDFSARSLDDFDEGVGEVRIVSGADRYADEAAFAESQDHPDSTSNGTEADTAAGHAGTDETGVAADRGTPDRGAPGAGTTDKAAEEQATAQDIIVLYILPKPGNELNGAQINSSAQAMGLSFGDMNIFHYRPGHRNIFSMANMLEPGSFDADTIHDLKTTGLTVFMQFAGNDPLDDLTEMLQRSYQLAGLLDARLCNSRRQPMTEQDAENYRERVRSFIARQ